jgi:hypothetical protein
MIIVNTVIENGPNCETSDKMVRGIYGISCYENMIRDKKKSFREGK